MSLHDKIMNIPAHGADDYDNLPNEKVAYKIGHRDARHEAAEMALAQDEAINSFMSFLQDIADDQYSCLNDLERTTRKFLAEMKSAK